MHAAIALGGTITGEHGVGLDKRDLLPLVFSEADMNAMLSVRAAFDPLGLCNPGKIIPMLRGCGEGRAIATENLTQMTQMFHTSPSSIKHDYSTKSVSSVSSVFPNSTEEVSAILREATAKHWTVAVAGSATSSAHKPNTDLILNTNRLDKIIEHEPADLIAIAQAGVKLTTFNEKLAENGQWLPLDPPNDGRATLGGVVATGLGGPQQFGYGRPRGSVIGMTVVLADGSVIKAGGRVVKNVAGYDLCKLFTGSYGTLGIITELIFKLRPRPAREATVVAIGTTNELLAAGRAILDARLFPVALELLSAACATGIGIASDGAQVLLVRFAGNDKSVAYQLEQALLLLKNSSVKARDVVADDAQVWSALAAIPIEHAPSIATRVLPTKVRDYISSMSSDGLWQAGLADGRVRTMNAPAPNHRPLDSLSQRVKQQLDPLNLLRGHDDEHAA
jgi:FAD/FMN-containing dehydrogenase